MLTPGAVGDDLRNFFHADQIATPIPGSRYRRASRTGKGRASASPEREVRSSALLTDDLRPVGWVATDGLQGHRTVRSVMAALDECKLVSAESSIASVLELIPRSKFLFVVDRRGLSGFIVRSDLDRHARQELPLSVDRRDRDAPR